MQDQALPGRLPRTRDLTLLELRPEPGELVDGFRGGGSRPRTLDEVATLTVLERAAGASFFDDLTVVAGL